MTPDFSQLRAERSDCPSDATLEEFGFDALPDKEAIGVRSHLKQCEICAQEVALVRKGFDAFPQLDERHALGQIHTRLAPRPAWWRRFGMLLVPLAIGGVAAIVFMTRTPPDPTSGGLAGPVNTVRTKGSVKLRIYAKTGDAEPTELLSGQPVAAGSRLRFVVDLEASGHVRIFGVEASGALYTAWPMESAGPVDRLDAGEHRLPGAAALDDSPTDEMLHLVWCGQAPPECTATGPQDPLECADGCVQTAFALKKTR